MATTAPTRYLTLDAIRGIAVMGIVLMNIFFFSMPGAAYFNPRAWGGMAMADLAAWATGFVVIEDKMRGLFAALFGASALLVIDRAHSRKANGIAAHYRRMAWLLLFGLLHGILIASNDILRLYALVGLLLPLFVRASARTLAICAAGLIGLHFTAFGYVTSNWLALYFDTAADAQALAVPERLFGFDEVAIDAQLALYRGDYPAQLGDRLDNPLAPVFGLLLLLPQTLGSMLIGAALLRSGFFTGAWSTVRLRRWGIVCFAIASPPLVLLAAWSFASDFAAVVVGGNALVWSAPFDAIMTIGWAALLVLLIERFGQSAPVARLAAAGRVAFTNYVGTSIVLATIFYGFGFGLYGAIGRIEAYLFVFAIWALMLLWSRPWLERFRYGPLEWLWRSLARWRIEPMRGKAAA